ncbi:LysR family transcriptional regulator [Alteromonas lipolytica]|nr:LysR family transcriptional regulator [Alteromonas lipolytica]GGF61040.1 LysR family transcriptional regulator [Alteromonas lipolytica]
MSKSLDLNALKIFVVVAESKTLTQAAERLGITQSAVSQTLKQLETITDSVLIERSSRPLRLTPSGSLLYARSQPLLNDSKNLLDDVKMAAGGGLSELRIGMIDCFSDVGGEQLVRQLQSFSTNFTLRTGLVSPLSQALLERELDLLVTSDPMTEQADLQRFPIIRDPFVIVVSDQLELDSETPGWLAKNLPFIQYDRTTRLGMLTGIITKRLRIEPNTRFELDSTEMLLKFVRQGHGWSIISSLCMVGSIELLHNIKVLNLDDGVNARYISLLSREGEFSSIPEQAARICRGIYDENVLPHLNRLAPWLAGKAKSTTNMPLI